MGFAGDRKVVSRFGGEMDKIKKVMHEYKHGKLHSGSKNGPEVKSRDQAIAIAMSEAGKSKKKSPMQKAHDDMEEHLKKKA